MRIDFMHLNDKLATVLINVSDGSIVEVRDVVDAAKMPVGTVVDGRFEESMFQSWWSRRAIPANRQDVDKLLNHMGATDTRQLLIPSLGMNLEDGYWLRPLGSGLMWEEINFYDNGFILDEGRFTAGVCDVIGSVMTPDFATGGSMRKFWVPIGKERYLIKLSGPSGIEAVNEVLSTMITDALDIPHVEYSLDFIRGRPISVCRNFLDKGQELVHAEDVMFSSGTVPGELSLDRYERTCVGHGVDVVQFMNKLTVLDYLIMNRDRHVGNLGVIRDTETLEWICPAPAYDHSVAFTNIKWKRSFSDYLIETSDNYWEKRLGSIRDLSWIDFDRLDKAISRVGDFLSGFEPLRRIGWDVEVTEMMGKRSECIEILANAINRWWINLIIFCI